MQPRKTQVEVDVAARYHDGSEAQNVVAELPGGKKKDEVVLIGAHLDSWHGGTGATDNAAGVAIMLEVVRILKALDLPLDRTVRLVFWSGEEQGLSGSRAYVRQHFGDPVTMALKGEHGKVAAYFNVDNGAGKVRGVYLQGNDMVRPILRSGSPPSATRARPRSPSATQAAPTTSPSTRWACRASSSSRTRSTT